MEYLPKKEEMYFKCKPLFNKGDYLLKYFFLSIMKTELRKKKSPKKIICSTD